jgi:hypothetical protein
MHIESDYNVSNLRSLLKKQIIKFPNIYDKSLQAYRQFRAKKVSNKILYDINKINQMDTFPIFSQIQVETFSKCNGGCTFCPVNRFVDPRPSELMEEKLFYKIINELSEINYSGIFYFHMNNEPLLDKRIYQFVKDTRKIIPQATLSLWTNGTPLNIEKFRILTEYLDHLVIDNYSNELKLHSNIRAIKEFCEENPQYGKKVRIRLRLEDEVLDTRASRAPNRKPLKKQIKAPCLYTFKQIIIRPDGKISLCCNDALGDVTLGDASKQKLINIWRGKAFNDVRKILSVSRSGIDICEGCDTLHVPNPDG